MLTYRSSSRSPSFHNKNSNTRSRGTLGLAGFLNSLNRHDVITPRKAQSKNYRAHSLNQSVMEARRLVNSSSKDSPAKRYQPENTDQIPKKHAYSTVIQRGTSRMPATQRSSIQRNKCQVENPQFSRTKQKLMSLNFSHHDPEACVCNSCNCGRHLCKLHVVKPEMSLNSVYRGDYSRKSPVTGPCNRPGSSKKPGGDRHLDMASIYGKEFKDKKSDIERPRPRDSIDVGGPSSNLTTYSTNYNGAKSPVNLPFIQSKISSNPTGLPFMGDTMYRKMYAGASVDRIATPKANDSLKTGGLWMGNTTYRDFFKRPKDTYESKSPRYEDKYQKNASISQQFQTNYRNQFISKRQTACPAKVDLETRIKGVYLNSKHKFNENSDFKSLSPDFHAISTSKHYYV